MSKYYLGVDLGSTTSKAVIINEQDEIIGRGITNTRANYSVAADIARDEAVYNARFSVLEKKLENENCFCLNAYKRTINTSGQRMTIKSSIPKKWETTTWMVAADRKRIADFFGLKFVSFIIKTNLCVNKK